jgi:hypothetical protein
MGAKNMGVLCNDILESDDIAAYCTSCDGKMVCGGPSSL